MNATENITAIASQRAALKVRTQSLKDQVASGQFQSVNAALLASYASKKHTTFNTYEGWVKAGKVVKKNSRPFLVWGRPVERTDEYGKTYSYFPVRYLYSNAQVVDQVQS
ncbi:MAG: hypothetical protein PHD25_01760 [Bacteroidales bacterium]|nr:hypothetical protein [Bacteroidales bacterium]